MLGTRKTQQRQKRTYGTRITQDVHTEAGVEAENRIAQNVDNTQNDPKSAIGGNDTTCWERGNHNKGKKEHTERG